MTEFVNTFRRDWENNRFNPLSHTGIEFPIEEGMTARQALKQKGLFTVEPCQMKVKIDGKWENSAYRELMRTPIAEDFAYRSFGTVGADYEPIQPEYAAGIWDDHVRDENGKPLPITSIRFDRRGENIIWASKLREIPVNYKGGHDRMNEILGGYVVATVPFTPGSAITFNSYLIAQVCTNGLTQEQSRWSVRVVHTGGAQETLVKALIELYAVSNRYLNADATVFNALAQRILDPVEVNWLINCAYQAPERPVNEIHPDYENMVNAYEHESIKVKGIHQDILALYGGAAIGADLPTRKNTAFGLVNAVQSYAQDSRTSAFVARTRDMLPGGKRAAIVSKTITAAMRLTEGKIAREEIERVPVIVR